jgi:hypothetical protein
MMGPQETRKAFDIVEAVAKGPPEDERKVTAIIQANMVLFKRNFPLGVAMELSVDPKKLATVDHMTWMASDFVVGQIYNRRRQREEKKARAATKSTVVGAPSRYA